MHICPILIIQMNKNTYHLGWFKLDFNVVVPFLACIVLLFIFGKIFVWPLKSIFKLIINSILGGVLIYVINIIGMNFNFHIGLNLLTAILVGILGIPGAALLIVLKIILRLENSSWFFIKRRKSYSTVTDLARFLGLSTSNPLYLEM